MSDVTRLIDAAADGDRKAAADLLPLVYDELRKLAAARMAAESPDHTLDATALVHGAYLRRVGPANGRRWDSHGHFFAAAEAMRRILVDAARRKAAVKHGGGRRRAPADLDWTPFGSVIRTIISSPCTTPWSDSPPTTRRRPNWSS